MTEEIIISFVVLVESSILFGIIVYKIVGHIIEKQQAKEKAETQLETLLKQSKYTQQQVESFWHLLRDLLVEIQAENQGQTEHPACDRGKCLEADSEKKPCDP